MSMSFSPNEVLPAVINAEILFPVHQFFWFSEGDMQGFLDLQDIIVSCLIQDPYVLPEYTCIR